MNLAYHLTSLIRCEIKECFATNECIRTNEYIATNAVIATYDYLL